MNNPLAKTVELSKNQKLKLLKDRLSSMFKEKNIDSSKVAEQLANIHKNKEAQENNTKGQSKVEEGK